MSNHALDAISGMRIRKIAGNLISKAEVLCEGDASLGMASFVAATAAFAHSLEIDRDDLIAMVDAIYNAYEADLKE